MTVLYWLRNDLRLHDNEALAALPPDTSALLPVYCFDPAALGPDAYLGLPKTGPHRLPFLLETLADLQQRGGLRDGQDLGGLLRAKRVVACRQRAADRVAPTQPTEALESGGAVRVDMLGDQGGDEILLRGAERVRRAV